MQPQNLAHEVWKKDTFLKMYGGDKYNVTSANTICLNAFKTGIAFKSKQKTQSISI